MLIVANLAHSFNSCRSVYEIEAQKQILFRDGRCFLCLKKQHVSRNCRSSLHGQHHVTIWFYGLQGGMAREQNSPAEQTSQGFIPGSNAIAARAPTLSMYLNYRTPVQCTSTNRKGDISPGFTNAEGENHFGQWEPDIMHIHCVTPKSLRMIYPYQWNGDRL